MDTGKTAAAVLQELAVQGKTSPDYRCVAQPGPQHVALFECHCQVFGLEATGVARTKKQAKQECAKALLLEMSNAGLDVPPPFDANTEEPLPGEIKEAQNTAIWASLLNEYCVQYCLPAPITTLIEVSGPPHCRRFTMRVEVGAHSHEATASTKKASRQAAARELLTQLTAAQIFYEDNHNPPRVRPRSAEGLRSTERLNSPERPKSAEMFRNTLWVPRHLR